MANEGISKLCSVLQERMIKTTAKPPLLEFGEIQADYSLLTNTFPLSIPQKDYLVCRDLTRNPGERFSQTQEQQGMHSHGPSGGHAQEGGTGEHVHPGTEGEHLHDVILPGSMRWLKPGDRVLVAWVGNDAVVIDIILPATVIG